MTYKTIMFQLDSATSLIQAAKNLMNAVVLTVKACYVASTKVIKMFLSLTMLFFFSMFFCRLLNFFQNQPFPKILSGIPSERQDQA